MIENLMQWLDEEVKKRENEMPETQMYLWGKYVEAAYIRDMLRRIIDAETKSQPLPKDEEIIKMISDLWMEKAKERNK